MEDWTLLLLVGLLALALVGGWAAVRWRATCGFGRPPVDLPLPPPLVGELRPNRLLADPLLLAEGVVRGPHSLLVEGDTIFAATAHGAVLKLVAGDLRARLDVRRTDERRGAYGSEPRVGRPLGLRRLNEELVLVVDAYFGVFTADFRRGHLTPVFAAEREVDGRRCRFLNDLELLDGGQLVLSDSSATWQRRDFALALVECPADGRLLQVDAANGAARVLLGGLCFPTGLQRHPDGESLLFAEAALFRVRRLWLTGERRGCVETFAENLPGLAANVRLSLQQTFYVALSAVRHRRRTGLADRLDGRPLLRRLLLAFAPRPLLRAAAERAAASGGLVLELDLFGHVVRAYHDPAGRCGVLAHASDDAAFLFIGGSRDFIAQVPKE
ncbi:Adipocyte plasma membrane-associated protein [Aphelenchoides fujianensis]|nr:Adipocyte plasma membrane-associated protein [Aphelenchoides fujianensis]